MEGTTKNTNSTANTTDTKIALGLLQQNQTFKAIYLKPLVVKGQKFGCISSLTCRSNMQPERQKSIMIDVCKP